MAASGSLKQVNVFVGTPDGKAAYDAFIANVKASPMAVYLDELRGIADGAPWRSLRAGLCARPDCTC